MSVLGGSLIKIPEKGGLYSAVGGESWVILRSDMIRFVLHLDVAVRIPSIGMDVEHLEPSCTVGGNVKWNYFWKIVSYMYHMNQYSSPRYLSKRKGSVSRQ